MSGILPLIVTSDVDATRRCQQRRSTAEKDQLARPAAVDVLGECDVPPRRLPQGRMKHMIHQVVVEGRLPTVHYNMNS